MKQHSVFIGGSGKVVLTIGSFSLLFGVLILLHPEILVMLIASFFITVGVILCSIGLYRYQRSKRMTTYMEKDVW